MGALDFFETHLIGRNSEVHKWSFNEWVSITTFILTLYFYIIIHTQIKITCKVLDTIVNSSTYCHLHVLYDRFWTNVPICGLYKIEMLNEFTRILTYKVIPTLRLFGKMIELMFHLDLSQQTFKNKKNIQILFTGESDEFSLLHEKLCLTTLILSNHRSINDYALISYILQHFLDPDGERMSKRDIIESFWEDCNSMEENNLLKVNFLGWGKIFNSIKLSLMKNIIIKDENYAVDSSNIMERLKANGNQILVVFPEVNILTTELGIIQRKLNQNYFPFVTKYYNVLYPRFKTFVNTINCLAEVDGCRKPGYGYKKNHQNSILRGAKIMLNKNFENLIKEDKEIENFTLFNDGDNNRNTDKPLILNDCIFDLTIIYYKVKTTEYGHDHHSGSLKIHKGVQLEQIAPSFLELLHINFFEESDPLFIMVDVRKHNLDSLLSLKNSKLEKWLELQWSSKEKLIRTNEENIRIR